MARKSTSFYPPHDGSHDGSFLHHVQENISQGQGADAGVIYKGRGRVQSYDIFRMVVGNQFQVAEFPGIGLFRTDSEGYLIVRRIIAPAGHEINLFPIYLILLKASAQNAS